MDSKQRFSDRVDAYVKYRPDYPDGPFVSLEAAQAWVDGFVRWYNEDHQHSGIRFVTPAQRHDGSDIAILENRKVVYEDARARTPQRWTRNTRNWGHIGVVELNPAPRTNGGRKGVPGAVAPGLSAGGGAPRSTPELRIPSGSRPDTRATGQAL